MEALTPVTGTFWNLLILGLVAGIGALLVAVKYRSDVMKASPGNPRMQEIAGYVRSGAMAYLNRQFKVVVPVLLGIGVLVAFGANYELLRLDNGLMLAGFIFLGFVTGGLGSFYTGWAGMNIEPHGVGLH
jgi:K(+)-stimulated pyrophosphate-energized sodium pump